MRMARPGLRHQAGGPPRDSERGRPIPGRRRRGRRGGLPLRRRGRVGADRRRLRAASGGHGAGQGHGRRRSSATRRRSEQPGVPLGHGRRRRRRGVRRRGGRRQGAHPAPEADTERDGAALGRRAVDAGLRRAHALEHDPEPAHRQVPHFGGQRDRRAQDQGDRPRGGRRVRQQDPLLPRRGHSRVLLDEDRPAREVDGDAQRGLPGHDSRPGPRRGRGAGRRQVGQHHRAQDDGIRRNGRLSVDGRARHPDDPSRPHVRRNVHHPERQGRRLRRLQQRRAGRGLPRRRASGGDLPRREDGRQARRRAGHGPGRRAARQPHPGIRGRPRHRHRADLRQRRLRRVARHGAGGGRLQGPAREAGASARRGPVHRNRRDDVRGDLRARPVAGRGSGRLPGRSLGGRDSQVPPDRQGQRSDRIVPARTGRGDDLRADRVVTRSG